jgi:hypothetical protein
MSRALGFIGRKFGGDGLRRFAESDGALPVYVSDFFDTPSVLVTSGVLTTTAGFLSNTTASFTPTAGALLIIQVGQRINAGTAPSLPTITDSAGLTWTQVDDISSTNGASPSARQTVWRTTAPANPAAMTITVESADTNRIGIVVIEARGFSPAIVNVGDAANNSGDPAPSITAPAAQSLVLGLATFTNTAPPTVSPLDYGLHTSLITTSMWMEARYTLGSGPSSAAWSSSGNRSVGALIEILSAGYVLAPAGVASGNAFGAPTVATSGGGQTLTATGYADADAFGAAAVACVLPASGFADGDGFGAAALAQGLTAAGYANTAGFGAAGVGFNLTAAGLADADAFGSASLGHVLTATAYADPDGFGAATIAQVAVLAPTGYADPDGFGAASLGHVLLAGGFANANGFGQALVDDGTTQTAKAAWQRDDFYQWLGTLGSPGLVIPGTPIQVAEIGGSCSSRTAARGRLGATILAGGTARAGRSTGTGTLVGLVDASGTVQAGRATTTARLIGGLDAGGISASGVRSTGMLTGVIDIGSSTEAERAQRKRKRANEEAVIALLMAA